MHLSESQRSHNQRDNNIMEEGNKISLGLIQRERTKNKLWTNMTSKKKTIEKSQSGTPTTASLTYTISLTRVNANNYDTKML